MFSFDPAAPAPPIASLIGVFTPVAMVIILCPQSCLISAFYELTPVRFPETVDPGSSVLAAIGAFLIFIQIEKRSFFASCQIHIRSSFPVCLLCQGEGDRVCSAEGFPPSHARLATAELKTPRCLRCRLPMLYTGFCLSLCRTQFRQANAPRSAPSCHMP